MALLANGRPTILASPEWKVIPWVEDTILVKDSPQHLIDILADVSAFVHAKSQNLKSSTACKVERDWQRRQAIQILRDLLYWRTRWDAKYPMAYSSTYFECPHDLNIQPFWSQDLVFIGAEHARWTVTFDAICIIALINLFTDDIQSLKCEHGEVTADPQLGTGEIHLDEQDYTSCISDMFHRALLESCQATSYYFRAVKEMDHPIDILIPLRQVWRNTRRFKCSWAGWLDNTMGKIAAYGFDGVPLIVEDD